MTKSVNKGFRVIKPGVLSLIQDLGRFGYHSIGLSSGGPMDAKAFRRANQLCGNDESSSAIEVTVGGLVLKAQVSTLIAVTGADMDLFINDQKKRLWRSHKIDPGDTIKLGYAQNGCRAYLAVAGGIQVEKSFGSTSTVVRESVGGINGGALLADNFLPCDNSSIQVCRQMSQCGIPVYPTEITLRLILGYQHLLFNDRQMEIFFNSQYAVSSQCDRMGYRLEGQSVVADVGGVLSEGISYGAVQFPPDGQPIVLLNDRQTIGGYPKMGVVHSADCSKLAQVSKGAKIRFEVITQQQAVAITRMTQQEFEQVELTVLT